MNAKVVPRSAFLRSRGCVGFSGQWVRFTRARRSTPGGPRPRADRARTRSAVTRGPASPAPSGLNGRERSRSRRLVLLPGPAGSVELALAVLHLRDRLLVRGGLDDLVELGPVVGDEAHALDIDVVDEPSVPALEHPVVDRDFGALLGGEPGLDRRHVAIDGIAGVRDLLAAVPLDLRAVRALEQVGEHGHELLAILLAEALPA